MFQKIINALKGWMAHKGQPDSRPFEKGVFQYDETLRKWVKVREQPQEEGKYAMPLSDYLHRRNHVSKGSWRRPIDTRHASKEALEHDDFGTIGCKGGVGIHHPLRGGRCKYCNLTPNQISDRQQQADRNKGA